MGDQTFESVLDPKIEDRTFDTVGNSDYKSFFFNHLFSGEACAALCLRNQDCIAYVFTPFEPRLCFGVNDFHGTGVDDGVQQHNANTPVEWGLSANRKIFVTRYQLGG